MSKTNQDTGYTQVRPEEDYREVAEQQERLADDDKVALTVPQLRELVGHLEDLGIRRAYLRASDDECAAVLVGYKRTKEVQFGVRRLPYRGQAKELLRLAAESTRY